MHAQPRPHQHGERRDVLRNPLGRLAQAIDALRRNAETEHQVARYAAADAKRFPAAAEPV
jgi:hypothetical protein